MKAFSLQEITSFQKKILNWYAQHQRDLPWRRLPYDSKTKQRDPYKILLSEIMSQQTQINRVIPKYEAWIERFPTINDLAAAPVADVLQYWSGLGYNRRALNLKKTAQVIVDNYNNIFPKTEKELSALPGIGAYTARAILCFAFNQQVAVVDTNVRKVISIEILENKNSEKKVITDKEIATIAEQLLPVGKAYEWNQALMDYAGAMLREHKIFIPKQSTFKGSRRYYRGQILKQLLEKKEIQLNELGRLIKKDFTDRDKEWLIELIEEMQKEGFVERENNVIALSL